jgi:predicted chitinase
MANILGEGFNNYVRKQVNERQKVHGSGVDQNRTPQEISYLNSRTGWIKVASSVSIDNTKNGRLRLKKLGLESEFGTGEDLAKNFVLFNGISKLSNKVYKERKGIWNPTFNKAGDINNRFKNDALYGGIGQDFGLAPTPGITNMDIQSINMGSLKSATINLKAYNRDQLDIIDLLYLRLGFTLLVEWGHSSYINNQGDITSTKNSIIDGSFFSNELIGKTYVELLPLLEKKRFISGGNYDAFFGRVTNFNWDFNPDGSYNIQIQLYSIGDVVESLKLNTSPPGEAITKYKSLSKSEQERILNSENLVERYQYENKIAAYFKAIKVWDERGIGYFKRNIYQLRQEQLIEETETQFIEQNNDTVNTPQIQNLNNIQRKLDEEKKYDDILKNFQELQQNTNLNLIQNGILEITEKVEEIVYEDVPLKVNLQYYSNTGLGTGNLNESYIGNILREKYGSSVVTSNGSINYNISILSPASGSILDKTEYVVEDNFPENSNISDYQFRTFFPDRPILNNLFVIKNGSEFSNNFPPYPNPVDFQIAVENEKRILEKYEEYLENQKEANQEIIEEQGLDPDQQKKSPEVYYILNDNKSQTSNKVEYGRVINFKEGWADAGLYFPQSLIADHYFSPCGPNKYQYYIRFGTFLGFLRDQQIYKIKSKNPFNPPLVDIDTDIEGNVMYTLPNHVSLDPRVCITNIKMNSFNSTTQTYSGLEEFQNQTPFYGKIMNIYLNHQFIMDVMLEHMDEKGNIYFYNVINSICVGINRVLGGINNLRPVIDESLNCVKIVDESTMPNLKDIINYLLDLNPNKYSYSDLTERYKYTKNTLSNGDIPYQLELFGYSKNLPKSNGIEFPTSNFVQNLSLRTQVTKELVTMLTIGATSQGAVVGEDLTSISKWNYGIFDRYNPEALDGNGEDIENPLLSEEFRMTKVKYTEFLINEFEPPTASPFLRYFPNSSVDLDNTQYNPEVIENNINYGTNFFKYLATSASIAAGEDTFPFAGTIGFLPIELNIDLDGISGMKIYQKIETNTKFLPNNYPDNLSFVTIGLGHKLVDNKWTTQVKGISQPIVNEQIDINQLFTSLDLNLDELRQQVLTQVNCETPAIGEEVRESQVAWIFGSNSKINSTTKSNNVKILIKEMENQGITSPYAQIGILAVVGKESGWVPKNELSYSKTSNTRLRKLFGNRLRKYKEPQLEKLKKDNIKFYDAIYGPASMKYFKGWNPDNKNPGDGYKYRGRGFNQVTFKALYRKYGKIAGIDLVKNPDLLNDVKVAAKVSVAFLKSGMEKVLEKEYKTTDTNSIQDISTGIYIATKANAGGGKDIRGTETFENAKNAGCNFWVVNPNSPPIIPGDNKPVVSNPGYGGLQDKKLYQLQTQQPTNPINIQPVEQESNEDIYNRLQGNIGPI